MTNARLEELRAKFQENPRRYFAPFANELRKAGDAAQAIEICRAHLAGQPGHVSGHIVLGQALYEAGESNEARDIFTAALELDPENLIALRSLGEIAQVNGEFPSARQWYERLLDADPRNNEVAQLLKDMPTEAKPAPVAVEPLPDVEEPTPFTVRAEIEETAPAPDAARSTFHTSFTGSNPAYVPKEAEAVPTSEGAESPSDDEAFVDLEPTAHEDTPVAEARAEPVSAVAEHAADSLDMVDFDSFPDVPSAEAMPSPPAPSVPDESFDSLMDDAPEAPAPFVEMEQHEHEVVSADELQVSENNYEPPAETNVPDESFESPRAMFAERGFDSPTHDEMGWMTTPSAALSDPEAAPEDWFDESTMQEVEASAETPMAEAPAPVEVNEPDHSTDSWFDEVEGASSIEPTEITSDELWLPPELPSFSAESVAPQAQPPVEEPAAAEMSSEPEYASQESDPEPVSASSEAAEIQVPGWMREPLALQEAHVESHSEEPAPSMMSPEPEIASAEVPDESEPAWSATPEHVESAPVEMDVHAIAEAADEAFVVEHPAEAPAQSWSEAPAPEPSAQEPIEAASMESDVEIIHAGYEPPMPAAIGHTSQPVEAAAPPPAPFVTETLADLYLQQGFRDEALAIFRQLAERDPDNEHLRARIKAIEEGDAPKVSYEEIPVEERASSQSVRTFFSRLARRPAVAVAESEPPAPPARNTPDVPFAAAASALANLFAASKPPASDEGAASTLAGAYTDPAGRPSRAADRELSLDHLFRDVPPGGSPGSGVTLDEFYSTQNAAQGSTTEPGEAEASEESGGTDIRQFTAWLEGLRKK